MKGTPRRPKKKLLSLLKREGKRTEERRSGQKSTKTEENSLSLIEGDIVRLLNKSSIEIILEETSNLYVVRTPSQKRVFITMESAKEYAESIREEPEIILIARDMENVSVYKSGTKGVKRVADIVIKKKKKLATKFLYLQYPPVYLPLFKLTVSINGLHRKIEGFVLPKPMLSPVIEKEILDAGFNILEGEKIVIITDQDI